VTFGWPGKLQRRAAEDALKVQLELRQNEGGHKNLAQDLCTSGWLDKLNSKSDPKDPGTCLLHAALMLLKARLRDCGCWLRGVERDGIAFSLASSRTAALSFTIYLPVRFMHTHEHPCGLSVMSKGALAVGCQEAR
jgi:hypothetical protein